MDELYRIIEEELRILTKNADIPIRTGNLRNAIKLIQLGTGFRIYLDEQQASYAMEVEERNPYWTRFAMRVSQRLAAKLGVEGRREDL